MLCRGETPVALAVHLDQGAEKFKYLLFRQGEDFPQLPLLDFSYLDPEDSFCSQSDYMEFLESLGCFCEEYYDDLDEDLPSIPLYRQEFLDILCENLSWKHKKPIRLTLENVNSYWDNTFFLEFSYDDYQRRVLDETNQTIERFSRQDPCFALDTYSLTDTYHPHSTVLCGMSTVDCSIESISAIL